MTTPRKPAKSDAVENSFSEEETFGSPINQIDKKSISFDDEDEFDLPLDDLDGLETFDIDDDDDF